MTKRERWQGRILGSALLLAALLIATCANAQTGFDFRTHGTRQQTYLVFNAPASLPAPSKAQTALMVIDPSCMCLAISENGGGYTRLRDLVAGGGSSSHTHSATQVTASPFATITGTDVQTQLQQVNARVSANAVTSVFGRAGAITALPGDYTAGQIGSTATGDVAATNVQAALAELASEKSAKAAAETISGAKTFSSTTAPIKIKPAAAPAGNTRLLDVRSSADSSLAYIDAEGDVWGQTLYSHGATIVRGKLQVGMTAEGLYPMTLLGSSPQLSIQNSSSWGADVGSNILLQGKVASLDFNYYPFATLSGVKANASSGDRESYFSVSTLSAGGLSSRRLKLGTTNEITGDTTVFGSLTMSGAGITTPTISVLQSAAANAYAMVGASGTGAAGLMFDASDADFLGGDYGILRQNNDLSIELTNFGANPLSLKTANTNRLKISGAGKVAIGGEPTTSDLQVWGDANNAVIRAESTGSANATLQLANATKAYQMHVAGSDFAIRDSSASSNRLVIDTTGNVSLANALSMAGATLTMSAPSGTIGHTGTGVLDINTGGSAVRVNRSSAGGAGFQVFSAGTSTIDFSVAATNVSTRNKLQVGNVSAPITGAVGLEVAGASSPGVTGGNPSVGAIDTTAMAANVGGNIAFFGQYTAAGGYIQFGQIGAFKENAVANDASGYFAVSTRHVSGALSERMRITSTGAVGIGTVPTSGDAVTVLTGTSKLSILGSSASWVGTKTNTNLVLGTNGADRITIDTSGNVTVVGAIATHGRSFPDGTWQGHVYAAGDYTAIGGTTPTWVVDASDRATSTWTLNGKTMTFSFFYINTTITGSPTVLRIVIPGGYVAAKQMSNTVIINDNGAGRVHAQAETAAGSSFLGISKMTGTAFTGGANTNAVIGTVTFEIQ